MGSQYKLALRGEQGVCISWVRYWWLVVVEIEGWVVWEWVCTWWDAYFLATLTASPRQVRSGMLAPRGLRGMTPKPAGRVADSIVSVRLGALISWIPDRSSGRRYNAAAEMVRGHKKSKAEKREDWNRYCMISTGSLAILSMLLSVSFHAFWRRSTLYTYSSPRSSLPKPRAAVETFR